MLRKRAIDYLKGETIAKLMSFAALIAMGAWSEKEDITIYMTIIFIAELLAIFITFGADSAIIKFYREKTVSEIFSNYIMQNLMNACIAAISMFILGHLFNEEIYKFIFTHYYSILSLAIYLSMSSITRAHMVSLNESNKTKWFSIFSGAINLLSTLIFAFTVGLTVFALITSRIVAMLIYGIYFIYLISDLMTVKVLSLKLIKKMYRFSVPILFSTIVGTINVYMSRIILAKYVSVYELGIFSFFIMIMASTTIMLHSFNQAWFPHLFDLHKNKGEVAMLRDINDKMSSIMKLAYLYIVFSIVAYLLSGLVSLDLNGYYNYRYVLMVLIDSMIFGMFYIIINPVLYIKTKTQYVAYASLIAFVTNVVLTLALVKLLGVFGASVSAVAITVTTFVLYVKFSQRTLTGTLINKSNIRLVFGIFSLICFKYILIFFMEARDI